MQSNQGFERDLVMTRENRARLKQNNNLRYWYASLYRELFADVQDLPHKRILEIGSGASPLKEFIPQILTSDVLSLDYVDFVFDCHEIADFDRIADHSLDIVTLTNVLHHLRDPLLFLQRVTHKLNDGGQVFIAEPYFSLVSYPIFKFLHPENTDFNIANPSLTQIDGPLTTSNQAIPYMLFFTRPDWRRRLSLYYDLAQTRIAYFSSVSYMMSGGISRQLPVPQWLYQAWFGIDHVLAKSLPRIFASFFTAKLLAQPNYR